MPLVKRVFGHSLASALSGVFFRLYRWFMYGGFLFRHDPRLVALLRSGDPAIFACWHQDFLYTIGYLSRWNPWRRSYVLASTSRDGALMAAAAEGVGFRRAVRGSSFKDGAKALLEIQRRLAARPGSCVVVCDGPRPPARDMKPGILAIARETGLPIWLVRTSYNPGRVLTKVWTRFVIPRPWSRGLSLADGPIRVPPDLDREGLERLRVELKARLDALADRADRGVGRQPTG
jgi:hypothetical protein